ncbi:MAG: zf-HC2 domain-containing protein [Oscillospiraceae bacterium]
MDACNKYLEMISCLIDGELSDAESAELHAHIDHCDHCKKVFDAFSDISNSLEAELVEPPPMLSKGIMFKINLMTGSGSKNHRFAFGRFTAIAACFAILIVAASQFGLFDALKPASSPENNSPSGYALSAKGSENDIEPRSAEETPPTSDNASSFGVSPADVQKPYTPELGDELNPEMEFVAPKSNDAAVSLMSATEITVYNGDDVSDKGFVLNISDEATLKAVAEILSIKTAENGSVPKQEPVFTIIVPAGAGEASNSICVWVLEGELWCLDKGNEALYKAEGSLDDLLEYLIAA